MELAPVQEHLTEPRIIRRRREQATAAGNPLLFLFRQTLGAACARPLAGSGIHLRLGKPWSLCGTQIKTGVMHAEGLGDAFFHKPVKWHSGNHFDDPP